MRILYLSDVHTDLMRTEWKLLNVLMNEEYDLVLSGGDWDVIPLPINNPRRILKAPLLSVYGNHDNPEVIKAYKALLEDGRPKRVRVGKETLVVCGFGGATVRDPYTYPETWHEPEYYLKKYLRLRERLKRTGPCDILITHESPRAIIDAEKRHHPNFLERQENVDYKSYRIVFDLIAMLLQPKLYLCGHVHSTRATYTIIHNADVFGTATQDVPVLKIIFGQDAYAIINTETWSIEIKDPRSLETITTIQSTSNKGKQELVLV